MFSADKKEIDDYTSADETNEISPSNLLWKQCIVYADLFKFYVDAKQWKLLYSA
jgi:hypothetical protein